MAMVATGCMVVGRTRPSPRHRPDVKRKELAWRGQGQAQVDKNTISEEEVYRIVGGIWELSTPGWR